LCSNDGRTTFGEDTATDVNSDGEIGCDEMLIHERDPLRHVNGPKTATLQHFDSYVSAVQ
jgi:hypothetical protein